MHIPEHLQRMESQYPVLMGPPRDYTRNESPIEFSLARLPGARLLKSLRSEHELDFLRTRVGVAFDESDDDNWLPEYHLGGGSFGMVGVYRKRDVDGAVVDELALKQVVSGDTGDFWDGTYVLGLNRSLMREAVIQRQLNTSKSENFVHLRNYKYFDGGSTEAGLEDTNDRARPKKHKEVWRYYQELAPYRDLFSIIAQYRCWNTYLPEAFLWHVFDSLAEAALRMHSCRWGWMPSTKPKSARPDIARFVVNFDIKPENIFMSYRDHRALHGQEGGSTSGGTSKYDYPVIKIGDFGLCEWTGKDDPLNPGHFTQGTSGHKPPEQVAYGAWWSSEGLEKPNFTVQFTDDQPARKNSAFNVVGSRVGHPKDENRWDDLRKSANFHHNNKLHVWAIGKVMYDMMSLNDPDNYWKNSTADKDMFIANDMHQFSDFTHVPFNMKAVDNKSPYSEALTDLVQKCLKPFWRLRISARTLKEETRKNMDVWDNKYTDGCENLRPHHFEEDRGVEHPKLFYRENEINDMPRGNNYFVLLEEELGLNHPEAVLDGIWEYITMQNLVRSDPDWAELKPNWDDRTLCTGNGRWNYDSLTHHGFYKVEEKKSRKFPLDYRVGPTGGLEKIPRHPHHGGPGRRPDDDNDDDNNDNDAGGDGGQQTVVSSGIGVGESASLIRRQVEEAMAALTALNQPQASDDVQLMGLKDDPGTVYGNFQGDASNFNDEERFRRRKSSPIRLAHFPSIPRAPSPDPDVDHISDPDDPDVEIAIRTLRNGRRVSYYRQKKGRVGKFDRNYVQRRRGEKVNYNVAPFMGTGQSKFQNALRIRRIRREQARHRRHQSQQARARVRERQRSQPVPESHQLDIQPRMPRPRPQFGPRLGMPTSWNELVRQHDSRLRVNLARANVNTTTPHVSLTSSGGLPDIVDVLASGPQGVQQQHQNQHQNQQQQQPQDSLTPLEMLIQGAQAALAQESQPQPDPQPQPQPQVHPSNQHQDTSTWTPEYTSAYTRSLAGQIPPMPPNLDPTDRTFNYNDTQGAYMRYVGTRLEGWMPLRPRPDGTGWLPGQWLEVNVYPDTEQNRRLGRVGNIRILGG